MGLQHRPGAGRGHCVGQVGQAQVHHPRRQPLALQKPACQACCSPCSGGMTLQAVAESLNNGPCPECW